MYSLLFCHISYYKHGFIPLPLFKLVKIVYQTDQYQLSSIMNCLLNLLRLFLIIPSGKSRLLDRIGLAVWTCLALAPVIQLTFTRRFIIEATLNQLDVFSFFMFLSNFGTAFLRASFTFPAIYFLVNKRQVLFRSSVKLPARKGIFCLVLLLSILSTASTISYTPFMDNKIYIIKCLSDWFLMTLSIFMVGTAVAQLTKDAGKAKDVSAICAQLEPFISLKSGISPLLFMVYFVKILILVAYPMVIFTGNPSVPVWVNSITVAYAGVYLFYINLVSIDAFDFMKYGVLLLR